jgi:hypothetical protein
MTSDESLKAPTDVDYDEEALRIAAERMHTGPGDSEVRDADPDGNHNREALHKAAQRMGAE